MASVADDQGVWSALDYVGILSDAGLSGCLVGARGDIVGEGGPCSFGKIPMDRPGQWLPCALTVTALSVYSMRMARVNITMPDDLHAEAKRAGLNISQVAQQAIAAELARLAKVAELDAYLADLDAELGPISDADRAEAKAWADKVLGADRRRRGA